MQADEVDGRIVEVIFWNIAVVVPVIAALTVRVVRVMFAPEARVLPGNPIEPDVKAGTTEIVSADVEDSVSVALTPELEAVAGAVLDDDVRVKAVQP